MNMNDISILALIRCEYQGYRYLTKQLNGTLMVFKDTPYVSGCGSKKVWKGFDGKVIPNYDFPRNIDTSHCYSLQELLDRVLTVEDDTEESVKEVNDISEENCTSEENSEENKIVIIHRMINSLKSLHSNYLDTDLIKDKYNSKIFPLDGEGYTDYRGYDLLVRDMRYYRELFDKYSEGIHSKISIIGLIIYLQDTLLKHYEN